MKYFILFILLFYSHHVFALTAETIQNMNLGTYAQTSTTAGGVLSYNSSISNLSGIVTGSSAAHSATTIRLTGNQGNESVTCTMTTASVVFSNTPECTITAQNFTFSSNPTRLKNNSKDVNIGATLAVSGGFCAEGTYYATATVQAKGKSTVTTDFTIQITIEAPLSIEETNGMKFGTFLSPNTSSSIILSPQGSYRTTGDITFVDTSLSPGEFSVAGTGSRQVYITLPASTTLTNANGASMIVDGFTSDPSETFIISGTGVGKKQIIKVGSALHVNKNQRSGNYTGTYPIIVSY